MPDWTFRLLRILGWLAAGFLTSLAVAWGACIVHGKTGWRRAVFSEGRSAQHFWGPETKGRPDRFGRGGNAVWASPYFTLFDELSTRTATPSLIGFYPDSCQLVEYGNRGWGVRTTQVGCYLLDKPYVVSGGSEENFQMPSGFDLEFLRIDAGWPAPAWSTTMELWGNPARGSGFGTTSAPMDILPFGDAGMLFRKTPKRNLDHDVWPTPSGVPLPFLPQWPGAATNTVVFTGIWFGLYVTFLTGRGVLRRRRGCCPRCGYAANGLTTCPECGRRSGGPAVAASSDAPSGN